MNKYQIPIAILIVAILVACGGTTTTDRDGGGTATDAARPDARGEDGATPVDAGPPGCISDAECDDDVDCTRDTCSVATGGCRHQVVPALCAAGSSCHPIRGCEAGRPCATSIDCEDEDACTVNERCDPAARTCVVDPLDGDGDGDPPRVCGGTDCDDSNADVYTGAFEQCNGIDDDCDGLVDDGFALDSDPTNCGSCGHDCVDGVCTAGACACTGGGGLCPSTDGSLCTDFSTDVLNCGGCGIQCPFEPADTGNYCYSEPCPAGEVCRSDWTCDRAYPCVAGVCGCASGTRCPGTPPDGYLCTDVSTDQRNCGSCGNVCPYSSTGSVVACIAGSCDCDGTICGDRCVDTASDNDNCGSCFNVCPAATVYTVAQTCVGGTCRYCGSTGSPCCYGTTCNSGYTDVYCDTDPVGGNCTRDTDCDPQTGVGCAAGQACYLHRTSSYYGPRFRVCATAGSLTEGAPCTRFSECASGLTCDYGFCHQICSASDGFVCPAGYYCDGESSYSSFGICVPL